MDGRKSILCNTENCIHNDDGECTKGCITIDYSGICEDIEGK